MLSLEFSKNVAFSKIVLKAGSQEIQMDGHVSGCYLTIEIKETLMNLYKAGTMKKGDAISFVIEGLCDARNNSNI